MTGVTDGTGGGDADVGGGGVPVGAVGEEGMTMIGFRDDSVMGVSVGSGGVPVGASRELGMTIGTFRVDSVTGFTGAIDGGGGGNGAGVVAVPGGASAEEGTTRAIFRDDSVTGATDGSSPAGDLARRAGFLTISFRCILCIVRKWTLVALLPISYTTW